MEDLLFEDSDSEYAEIEVPKSNVTITALPDENKKRVVASPRISKQLSKNGSSDTIILTPQKAKTARNLKQQFLNTVSPSKRKSTSITKHVPLTEENRKDFNHVPYYLLNFESICRGVIDETTDRELFENYELELIERFRNLDLNARKMYVRLFQRKHSWILRKNISYDEIRNSDDNLRILCQSGFLRSGSELDDLTSILNILSAKSVKELSNYFNLSKNKQITKEEAIQNLMAHSKKRSFFTTKNSMTEIIIKKAKSLESIVLDECYRVEDGPRCIFIRIFSLYSLSNFWEDRESDGRKNNYSAPQLTTLLLQNTGKLIYPVFKIIRERKIFRNREDLLQFESVCALESDVAEAFANKKFESAIEPIKTAIGQFQAICKNEDLNKHVLSLPHFLRKFTSGSVLAYIMTKGVEVYERFKQYDKAVLILKELLNQDMYLPDYHGHWYERLILDLDQHLKNPKEALKQIKLALDDQYVQEARLLALSQRVTKIANSGNNKKSAILSFDERIQFENHSRWLTPQEPITETIQGKMMPKSNLPGEKTVFVVEGKSENESSLLCSVEEYVKDFYKKQKGYTNGLHAEGSLINSITNILFWDIIFDLELPDVFRTPHQAVPLDFDSPCFYKRRKIQIEKRLHEICDWPHEKLTDLIVQCWESSCHITACPVHWDLFNGIDQLVGLIKCFTGSQLSGICRRLMTNHRHTRSGFPDLTMWDTNNHRVVFVEVKGPNDRLSNKQILWLDYLNSLGLTAIVCHIEPINAKRMTKKSEKNSPKKKKKRQRIDSGEDFVL